MLIKVMQRFLLLILCGLSFVVAAKEPSVLAEWDGIQVTDEDVERYLTYQRPDASLESLLGRSNAVLQYVQNILIVRALSKEAENAGLAMDAEQLAWQLEYQTATWQAARLQENAVSESQENVDWEALAKEKYLAEPERFTREPTVNAAHILISTKDKSAEQALAEITQIRERALAGEDFKALAKEYSDDTGSAPVGGELGDFEAKKMVKPFADAAFALENNGDISEPVLTRFGYHIIKLNRKNTLKRDPFIAVQRMLIEQLKRQRASDVRGQTITRIRTGTLQADINHEAVTALEAKYGAEPASTPTVAQ